MRINHNLTAINTHRQMGISELDGSKSMEKLSSGFRINRAGDDAAGLAISEKMRGQVRGLSMASKNSSDTISLIQTAEGALAETHSILQRMRELSVQSANDTNTDKDREELQAEVTQLKAEIDRIGNTTEFNTKKLLEGSATGVRDEITGTLRVNNNSSVVIDANKEKAMYSSIANDKSWAFDGAYMLVKTNQTHDADGNNIFKAEDYNLVGPDGNVYKFKTYTPDTKIQASGLEAGTIVAEGGETRIYKALTAGTKLVNGTGGVDPTLATVNTPLGGGATGASVLIGAELTEKDLQIVAEDSVLVAGSSFTINKNAATPAVNIGSAAGNDPGIASITLDSDDRLTLDGMTAKVEVGQSVILDNGTVIKNNGGGKVSVENGSLILGTDGLITGNATATANNVVAFSLASQSAVDLDSTVTSGDFSLVLASNLRVAAGTFDKNVTVGNSAGLVLGDVGHLETGTVLAKGSMMSTDSSTNWSLKIEVKGKEVEVKWDTAANVLTVGGEMVAAGKSITLEDGTVLTHKATLAAPTTATGDIFIEHGSIKLAEDIAYGSGLSALLDTFIIAKDSTLVAGSALGGAGLLPEVRLMAGTVINEGNADKTFSGSVTIADQGKNMQFSANTGNGLATRYYDLKVTDSFTFIFSKYDAASSNLADSIMSQIGANSGQTTFLSINDMRCKALGVADVDISTKWGAATAIETVNNALQKVSHQRSSLGALQNRLEHTIKNLDTAAENLQAAESRIRDVDMAKEVMEFTRNNILQQASQAMLAQANQQPQSVLQLLR
jgi:flagellin